MEAVNPATGQLIKNYDEHSSDDINTIIDDIHAEYLSWRQTSFAHRSILMKKAAQVLRDNANDYASIIALEMGKPVAEGRAEIEKCAWVCDYYAENAEKQLADEYIASDASKSFVAYEPIGVVLAVMPWNFPFWQVFRFAAPALMAGNAGVLKHASNVPGSALAIEAVFDKAGFPKNIFRSLIIGSQMVEDVIMNKKVMAVTLTGSEPAGMAVASTAGKALKKSLLELGGSDPYIVLEDADMPACVNTSATSRMLNAGQSCIAAKRFIVVDSVADRFEQAQTEIMKNMKVGDPLDESTQVGPLARFDLAEELHEQVVKSIEKGARVLCGAVKPIAPGAFYQPTVLTDVVKGMPVYDEETFGPVSAIIRVKDADEAIAVANDSEFGLGGSIWTNDTERGITLARKVFTGAMFVNGMTKSDPRLPFGGVKKSGYGRELSYFGIREFVNAKTIWVK